MNLRKLSYFVSLANHLNYTRAAEENYISQPTMTAQINSLEEELQVKLFERSNKSVSLTASGELFLKNAVHILNYYQSSVQKLRDFDKRQESSLSVGFSGPIASEYIPTLIATFKSKFAKISLNMKKGTLSGITQDLKKGIVDVIFSNQFEIQGHPELDYEVLFESGPCVIINSNHPLANKKYLTLQDLRGERLFATKDHASSELSRSAQILQSGGLQYKDEDIIYDEEVVLSMVAGGLGLFPTSRWYNQYLPYKNNNKCLDLHINVENMKFVIAWQKDNNSFALKQFIDISQNYQWGKYSI
ncbi:LysR family transcriptional regulator [Oscillospiraceae bacterium LTW-04]|nr:LysR family transcriptional regulator [Oscillospiraceae bacterium MB24-C1]